MTEHQLNLDQLISFLGHASSHPPLDDFLENSDFKRRPKGDDSLVAIVDATKTVTLDFSADSTYKADIPEGPKSDGRFILRAIDVDKKFSGSLPFGLRWIQQKAQVDELLGAPVKVAGDLIATYYKHGHLIVVRFTSGGRTVSSVRVAIKDRYHAKNFGI